MIKSFGDELAGDEVFVKGAWSAVVRGCECVRDHIVLQCKWYYFSGMFQGVFVKSRGVSVSECV